MHTTSITHVKDFSSLRTQLLWAVFHQISRQHLEISDKQPPTMQKSTPYHTSFRCIPGVQRDRHHRRHPSSLECTHSDWTHWRSCTGIDHVHVHVLTERCQICCSGAREGWKLW